MLIAPLEPLRLPDLGGVMLRRVTELWLPEAEGEPVIWVREPEPDRAGLLSTSLRVFTNRA